MEPLDYNKLLALFQSRKFWALILAIVTAFAAFATGEVTVWQLAQGIIAALAVYTTGVAIEDAGRGRGV